MVLYSHRGILEVASGVFGRSREGFCRPSGQQNSTKKSPQGRPVQSSHFPPHISHLQPIIPTPTKLHMASNPHGVPRGA